MRTFRVGLCDLVDRISCAWQDTIREMTLNNTKLFAGDCTLTANTDNFPLTADH